MQQHSELSHVQHCDGSNASDVSVQKVKLTGHTSKNNNKSFYNVVKLIVICLKVIFIVLKLFLAVVTLRLMCLNALTLQLKH